MICTEHGKDELGTSKRKINQLTVRGANTERNLKKKMSCVQEQKPTGTLLDLFKTNMVKANDAYIRSKK